MRLTLLFALIIALAPAAFARDAGVPIPLYEPSPTVTTPEITEKLNGQRIIRNVTQPTLTAFLPKAGHATGAAVIIAPGGAFVMLSIDSEGRKAAEWLADHGIAAYVLKYRLNQTATDTKAFSRQVTEVFTRAASGSVAELVAPQAVEDGRAAVRLLREQAHDWSIDPDRIGFLGFSAGAIVALQAALSTDRAERPNFVAPIYGPIDAVTVPVDAPPMFAAMAADDQLFGGKGFGLIDAWIAAKRPAELHVFAKGGHGFGMNVRRSSSDHWIDEFFWWMQASGFLKASEPPSH